MAPKVFDVLRYLVENAGRLVTQQELLDAVWPDAFVQPEILRKYILEIRKALGDPPTQPMFIETLPKRGYRFIAPVSEDAGAVRASLAPAMPRFVGREGPLAELHQRMDAALSGQRQIVFITGEGGIGKTTLLDAFEQESLRRPGLRSVHGQCVEGFGGKESYYPVLEAFGPLIEGAGGEGVIRVLALHAPTWLVQFPSAIRAEQRQSLQQEILGATRERMVREICEALERLSADQPLILLLEDLQWVDDSTLDLISALARRRGLARLMLVATYRPVDVILSPKPLKQMKQDLLVHRLCHEISLDPLTELQVERFLSAEFPGTDLPHLLAGIVHRRSDGNPMFMVAMIDQLRQKGLLAQEGGRWRLTAPLERLDPGVPQTLQQLIEIQIDRLAAEERNLLAAASVAGRRFSVWALGEMLEFNAGAGIEQICESLVARQQFLRRAGTQELADGSESSQYEFQHALYREVLYGQLSATQGRRLHARLAESMEALSTVTEQAMASELALHFEEARSYPRAVRYLILSASNARRRYAHDDSIRLLRHALDLLANVHPDAAHDLRIQILERISDALYAQGEMLQSADIDRAVVEQAAQYGFVVAQVNSLTRLARALAFMDPDRCISVCERAVELSRTQADPLLQARAEMLAACWRLITNGWREEDAKICSAARETIRQNNTVPAYYEILYAHVQCICGDYEGAYQTATAGIPKSIENDSLVVYLSAHSSLAQALLPLGRLGELASVLRTALEVSEKNRNGPWLGIFQANLAWVRLQCGDFAGARGLAEELIHEHLGEPAGQIRTMAAITQAYLDLESGLIDTALERFSALVGNTARSRFFLDWFWRMMAQLGISRAWLAKGETANANEAAAIFIESAKSSADPRLHALAWELNAELALQAGDCDRAREYAKLGLGAMDSLELPMVSWRIEMAASECCRAAGDTDGCRTHRRRAAALVNGLIGSFPQDEPLREKFAASAAVRRVLELRREAEGKEYPGRSDRSLLDR